MEYKNAFVNVLCEKYFEGSYQLIDKLYYVEFFIQHNLIYCGMHRSWNDSGKLIEEFFHNNGNIFN